MSEELEALRRGFRDFWERGDWSAVQNLPRDFVSESDFFFEFRATGPEGFERIFRDLLESFPNAFSNNRFEDLAPGRVLVEVVTGGRAAASGVETQMEFVQVWRFEDGVPRRVDWYRTREQALAAEAAEGDA